MTKLKQSGFLHKNWMSCSGCVSHLSIWKSTPRDLAGDSGSLYLPDSRSRKVLIRKSCRKASTPPEKNWISADNRVCFVFDIFVDVAQTIAGFYSGHFSSAIIGVSRQPSIPKMNRCNRTRQRPGPDNNHTIWSFSGPKISGPDNNHLGVGGVFPLC